MLVSKMITYKKQILIYSLISSILSPLCGQDVKPSELSREKRTLLYPEGASRIQVITGFGVPVDLKRETVIVGTVFKANYVLPMNVSQIIPSYISYERKKRSASRWDIYTLLSQALQMRGFEGRPCILRAICEVARTPLEKNYGLFHELIHMLFTPTATKEKVEFHADNEYYAAQMIGKKNGRCDRIFRDCSTSLIDLFTIYNNGIQSIKGAQIENVITKRLIRWIYFPVTSIPVKMIKCRAFISVIILQFLSTLRGQNVTNIREKRTLIWPEGGSKLLAICGFGVPVDLESDTVIVGMVFKANYRYPTNATEVTNPIVTYERRKRGLTRWDIYDLVSRAMDLKGLGGKPCLLRTICEIARSPVVENFGLFHELVHTFFKPSSTAEEVGRHSDNEYYAAEFFGKKRKNCSRIFKECRFSFLDMFTVIG